jgi:hypothetical protein
MVFLLLLFLWCGFAHALSYEAFVIVPYADVLNNLQRGTQKEVAHFYNTIPLSPTNPNPQWPRIHQVIFNETVSVLQEQDGQAQVQINSCFLFDQTGNKTPLKGWVLSSALYPKKRAVINQHIHAFPEPIDYQQARKWLSNTVVIYEPWVNQKTGVIYSAGTRFIHYGNDDDSDFYRIIFFDTSKNALDAAYIPKYIALLEKKRTPPEQLALFLNILHQWSSYHLPIAYVFGGSTFTRLTRTNVYVAPHEAIGINCWNCYDRDEKPVAGLDCSGLLLRAAQIAGMPYYFKNTTTILRGLKALTEQDSLSVGDLVWTAGHVIAVSSLMPPKLTEAAGYGRGYGIVHTLNLSKRFAQITNWHELLSLQFTQRIPLSLNANGSFADSNNPIVFLRLASLWDTAHAL